MENKKIYEKMRNIQISLKAPKKQTNTFGKYKYRNLEDILSSLKPILKKHSCIINLSDEIINISERFYVKATATLICIETEGKISSSSFARESEIKKGMDSSQITGSSSSYARKYALNGLLAIDDTKDSDFHDNSITKQYTPSHVNPKKDPSMLFIELVENQPDSLELIDNFKNMNIDEKRKYFTQIKNRIYEQKDKKQ